VELADVMELAGVVVEFAYGVAEGADRAVDWVY